MCLRNFTSYSPFQGEIIAECDPMYAPADGEMMGLRNIHIYGLANVLKRPIILLDSMSGITNVGDYSGKKRQDFKLY